MIRFFAKTFGAALGLAGCGALLLFPGALPAQAPLPPLPKNLADPLLGATLRVDASAGIRQVGNFPVPLAASGMPDASALLGPGFDGLEFSAGVHSLTLLLPQPQVVDRVAFLDQTAEGSFTVLISGTDPQLLAQGQGQPPASSPGAQTVFHGPSTVQAAVFQPQSASFVQVQLRLAKAGRLARFAVYGPDNAETDYSLSLPPGAAVPAGTRRRDVDVAALGAGARAVAFTSGRAGADPATVNSDALGACYFFSTSDAVPAFDLDLKGERRADRAVLFLSGPPCKVEVLRIPVPPAPAQGRGVAVVRRVDGQVETLDIDGSGMHPVAVGDTVPPGKVINVGFDSRAEVELDGTSTVRIGANSNVALRRADGASLSLLRGALLWQVTAPGGGGELATPTLLATVEGGLVAAEVQLDGEGRIGLLGGTPGTAGGPGPVAIRLPRTGEFYRLHPGEGAVFASSLADPTELGIKPFSAVAWWQGSPLGQAAGPLHDGAEKAYFDTPLPAPAGEVIGSATTAGGLAAVQISFPTQSLEMVRFRITPLAAVTAANPIAVVKALLLGTYAPEEAVRQYHPSASSSLPAAAPALPSTAAPASAAPMTPPPQPPPQPASAFIPIPAPVSAPTRIFAPAPSSAPAPPLPVSAPSSVPASAPKPAPVPAPMPAPAPVAAARPQPQPKAEAPVKTVSPAPVAPEPKSAPKTEAKAEAPKPAPAPASPSSSDYVSESSSVLAPPTSLPRKLSIQDAQSSKGAPRVNH